MDLEEHLDWFAITATNWVTLQDSAEEERVYLMIYQSLRKEELMLKQFKQT